MAAYRRILLKLSGEVLAGNQGFGIDPERVRSLAAELTEVARQGIQLGLVVGGGNFFRGVNAAARNMNRVAADHMGMLATVINGVALQDALEKQGMPTRVMTAIHMNQVAEPYIQRRAIRHLEKGRIVIFAAGTGNPFMTTDTAGALRAIETDCEVLLMAKNGVDGVYDADPAKVPTATRFERLSHIEAIQKRLQVMDITALSMCMEHHLPIVVFDVAAPDAVFHALRGDRIGTVVSTLPEADAPGGG